MRPRGFVIAIDGPSGAGKSTVGRLLAKRLGYVFLDTGAMYRAVALKSLRERVATSDAGSLAALAKEADIVLTPDGRVCLDGADVSTEIRGEEVGAAASRVSAHPEVRREMVSRQRELGREGGVVLDGRDIGTVVFPDADVKFFVDARPSIRAERRRQELARSGVEADPIVIEREMQARDHADSTRTDSPLARAPDAFPIDTSELAPDQVATRMMALVAAKGAEHR